MNFEFIEHCKCSKEELIEISVLKNESWEYPIQEHLNWISRNLQNDDIHLLLRNGKGDLIAYINLIKLTNLQVLPTSKFIGFGNLCVSKANRRKRLGFLLINLAEYYCYQDNSVGILLCKEELDSLYFRCKLSKYTGIIKDSSKKILNCSLFSTEMISSNQIILEKLF